MADLDALRREHQPVPCGPGIPGCDSDCEGGPGGKPVAYCLADGEGWPCAVDVLLAERDRHKEQVGELFAACIEHAKAAGEADGLRADRDQLRKDVAGHAAHARELADQHQQETARLVADYAAAQEALADKAAENGILATRVTALRGWLDRIARAERKATDGEKERAAALPVFAKHTFIDPGLLAGPRVLAALGLDDDDKKGALR